MKFIEKAFSYLEKEVPDYKKNKYYQGRGLKRIIEKNKFLTKLYVKVYKQKKFLLFFCKLIDIRIGIILDYS